MYGRDPTNLGTALLDVGVLDVERSLDIHDVGVAGDESNRGLAVYISGIFIFDWLNKPDID